ncbi:FKBP-type peptidyl-prolyl cis-trans isomerase [Georgenia sp. Z1491]
MRASTARVSAAGGPTARGPALRVAAATCALALGLGACGPGEDGSTGESGSEAPSGAGPASEVPGVSVAGAPGHPVVVIDTPLPVTDPVAAVVDEGDGRALTAGGPALLDVAAWDGTTGASSSPGEDVPPRLATVSDADVGATLAEILPGVPEGSRILVAEPVDVEGALTMQVVVVDVLPTVAGGAPAESASGEAGSGETGSAGSPSAGPESPSEGDGGDGTAGPTVGRGADGAPVVGIPPGDPPTDLDSRVVVEGDGATVRPGQELVLQTLTLDWATGEVFSSTWADGAPTTAGVGELAEGVRLALLDRRVGSRVLVVVPPGLGDGEHTLVVVVDVLAASGGDDVVR